jgi:hypothetical protein
MIKNMFKEKLTVATIIFAIGAIFFFVFGVMDKWNDIDAKKEAIRIEMETLGLIERTGINNPTNPKIKAWINYKNELEKEYARCLEYYKQTGSGINKWFEGVKINDNGEVNEESFINAYNTAKEKSIFEPLEAKKIGIVNEKGVEVTRKEDQAEILSCEAPLNKGDFKSAQKFFWVNQKLVNAIIAPEIEAKKCGPIIFDKTTQNSINNSLGSRIKFEITVYLSFKCVDKLLYNMLRISEGDPVLDIQKIKIDRAVKQQEEIKEQVLLMDQKGKWSFVQNNPYIKLKVEGVFFDFEVK